MKTYCKNVDITDERLVSRWVYEYIRGIDSKESPKWMRKDYRRLLSSISGVPSEDIFIAILGNDTSLLGSMCNAITHEVCTQFKNRELKLEPIRFFKHIDGISLKEREISHESPLQQVMDAVLVRALMPLFKAKILPHQYASIKGRGQIKGVQKIEHWIRCGESKCTRYGKADVQKCFPSIKRRVVMRYLKRDIHKNKLLLWAVDSILGTYKKIEEDGTEVECGLVIGTLLSQWLCNYTLSHLFRYMQSVGSISRRREGKRRSPSLRGAAREGKFVRYAKHILFYMDDILILGNKAAHLKSVLKKSVVWAKENLGLTIHKEWFVAKITNRPIDMMGFVVGYKCTTIRAKIFIRARRNYIRAAKYLKNNKRLSLRRARSLVSYFGYFKYSNSENIRKKLQIDKLFCKAKKDISYYAKKEHGRENAKIGAWLEKRGICNEAGRYVHTAAR